MNAFTRYSFDFLVKGSAITHLEMKWHQPQRLWKYWYESIDLPRLTSHEHEMCLARNCKKWNRKNEGCNLELAAETVRGITIVSQIDDSKNFTYLTDFLPKEMKSSNTASSWNQFSRSSAWFWFSTCPNWEGKMTHRISGKKEQRMTLIITNIQHQTCEIWLTRSVRAFLPPFLENKSKWIVISHLEWFQLFWFVPVSPSL